MSKPFDSTKPVQTRGGRPARIVCRDAAGPFPIIAAVLEPSGSESAKTYAASGLYSRYNASLLDLINVPKKYCVRQWISVDEDGNIKSWALCPVHRNGIVALKEVYIELTEGEGL